MILATGALCVAAGVLFAIAMVSRRIASHPSHGLAAIVFLAGGQVYPRANHSPVLSITYLVVGIAALVPIGRALVRARSTETPDDDSQSGDPR